MLYFLIDNNNDNSIMTYEYLTASEAKKLNRKIKNSGQVWMTSRQMILQLVEEEEITDESLELLVDG